MSLLIGITQENIFPNEAKLITTAIESGLDVLHIRKPYATGQQIAALLAEIPERYYLHIAMNDFHHMAITYALGGVHVNKRNPIAPDNFEGRISRSCHTLTEVVEYKNSCNYLFLSPIYKSISKQGYDSPFTLKNLQDAAYRGIIDNKVVALGGITLENVELTMQMGFGGVAVLGCLWKSLTVDDVKQTVVQLKNKLI